MRARKNYRKFNINMSEEAYQALIKHCEIAGQTATYATEQAILKQYGKEKNDAAIKHAARTIEK